jgi:predicted PurR-regulated permease PerM
MSSYEDNQNSLRREDDQRFQSLSRYTILILFIIVSALFVPVMRIFFVPIVVAAVFAALLYPIYNWFYRRLWKKAPLASLLCCLLLILVVLIPSTFIIQSVIRQMRDLYSTAIPWLKEFMQTWQDYPIVERFLNSRIGKWLATEVNWSQVLNTISRNAASLATAIINRTYTGVFGLAAELVIMIFTLFYFLIDGKNILERIQYLLPLKMEYQQMAISSFLLISKAIIKGTLIIGLTVGFLSAITLLIFGISTWLFWGFVIVIFSIIPMLGPSLIMVPAALIKMLTGHVWQGIGILLITYIVLINVDNVIRPRIVGGSGKMHDLLVFFSTLGGLSVFGIMGFIIGPIIAALFLTVLKIYNEEFKNQLDRRAKPDSEPV